MARRTHMPRGGGLFGDAPTEHKAIAAHHAKVDGGARGNPGPAAYGVVIRDAQGEIVARLKKYIGQNTNNVAEYFGLIAALDYAETHGIRALRVESDSELMVKQMRGQYKVKSGDLRPLFERAKKMAQTLESFRIEHLRRDQNREADALVNQALDETSVPLRKAKSEKLSMSDRSMRLIAQYKDGFLHPEGPLDLPEGCEVEILLRLKE